jgi:hypothetical protein
MPEAGQPEGQVWLGLQEFETCAPILHEQLDQWNPPLPHGICHADDRKT